MMASVLLLGIIISIEAPGVAAVVRREHAGRPLELSAAVLLPMVWVTLLCATATLTSLRLALARLARLEL